MKRVLIICNKGFEVEGVLSAILNEDIRHKSLDFKNLNFKLTHSEFPHTHPQGYEHPRAVIKTDKYFFEIWCIQNIMTPNPTSDSYYYSYSAQKAIDFPKILNFSKQEIQMIIAFGTAGLPSEVSKNGCVIIGSNTFAFDAYNPNPGTSYPRYSNPDIGKLIQSTVPDSFFDKLNIRLSKIDMNLYLETTALTPPLNAANAFRAIIDKNIVAVSDVNVKSYSEYKIQDPTALAAYAALKLPQVAYSIETTHGLIRLEGNNSNFIFVSAITDRDAYFDNEDTPKVHAQNFTCSFNGGMFLSFLIPFIEEYNF